MKSYHEPLVKAWTDYVAGRINARELKGHSAGFGIYQQRDGRTMMRLRRVGGFLDCEDLRRLLEVMRPHADAYAHLTTRRDVQLHGVPAEDVASTLGRCEERGFHFRGGGGDTFRSVLTSVYSGLHPDSAFDVVPYAQALSEEFAEFDRAYALPRKLKIAFADRAADAALAQTNDLGFVAKVADGRRVFETYLGGGIGSGPRLGFRLFDALPASDCVRAARALTALFDERGCRSNRAHARIRFLRDDFGDQGLADLFMDYFARERPVPDLAIGGPVPPPAVPVPFPASIPLASSAAPADWRALAVAPLAHGLSAVRLFVPFGNFTQRELLGLLRLFERLSVSRAEILPSLDLGVVVADCQVDGFYAALAALGRDYCARSFVGNVRTCVGCGVCTSGVTDAPAIGRAVADHFDARYAVRDTPEKVAVARALLNDVRISGCPNSCTCQQLAAFGFSGRRVDGAAAETVYSPGSVRPPRLGEPEGVVSAADLPAELERRILASVAGAGASGAPPSPRPC